MGGASTGPRKWMPLSFACNSGNGEGMDMERWGGRLFESGKESFRPGTENKKPLTEMSP